MGIVDSIKRVVSGKTVAEQRDYRCEECDHAFESAVRPMNEVTCPACDAGNVRQVED